MSDQALGGNAAKQLRAYVTRIERIEAEVAELNDGKSEVYAEAKACGFDKKVMRKLIQRRRKGREAVEEEDAILELYEAAVNGVEVDPLA
ncbi:DUF2312 domain-containing protein [Brucella abortus]|uniref:DUF2312 domain-containing protein n=1 Tax=Brucella abortus TaxID=235 RepID=UPI0004E8EFEE|nr:DUF2312 domain-containing protein [Brucella abortus]KFH18467.1 hypothetical protein IB60_17365 [Brucella abortus LMN1]RUQ67297.1 DUF2312 domain-containing protein [Brucella abortus]RUQ78571.1 DUF2312 domain-containing protein [Brucella abortus]RUQ88313.1 DUF2312 domain-containing protein [Brucella abortus]RUQ96507.1 DUF2312 domain-containing protein [Brucella abortus]